MAAASKSESYAAMDFDRGTLSYALKQYQPQQNRHSRGYTQEEVKDMVFQSSRLQRVMEEEAQATGQDLKDVHTEARALLDEIAHNLGLPPVRLVASLMRGTIMKILDGIYVNKEGLEQLRQAVENWPVVILPSHRSYLDFLIVSYVMFEHDIQLPCIAAGQDFMNMKFVSPLLRRCGAFFLRRTFGSDRLYKAVFTQYTQTLMYSCDNPMEFFIEGTRSRTAKSLHPRLGLLSMVVEPYLAGILPDVYLVPVSISYERTLEEQLFSRELLGVPKPKESTSGLLKARAALTDSYGSITVHISTPLSLHEFCQSQGVSRVPHTLFPKDVSVLLPRERELVTDLGHVIIDRLHQGMKVYPSVLVATALLQHSRGLAIGGLVQKVEWMKEEVERCGGSVNWDKDGPGNHIDSSLRLLSVAVEVTEDHIVRPKANPPPPTPRYPTIQEVAESEIDQRDLDSVLEAGLIYLLLAHYRNQLLYLFVPEAMTTLALRANPPCDKGTALKRFEALHCALAKEFVLPLKSPADLFSESLQSLLDRGVLLTLEDGKLDVNSHAENDFLFLSTLLLPFVAGVWVLCQHVLSFARGAQSVTATVKGTQLLAAKCIHTGLLDSHEVLSLQIVKNALASLTQAGLIMQPSSEVEGRDRLVKVADLDKLKHLTAQLGSVLLLNMPPSAKL